MPSTSYARISISKRERRCRWIRRIIEVLFCSCVLAIALLLAFYVKGRLLRSFFDLKPNTTAFQNWQNPPIHTTRSYYLFNITNPIEFLAKPSTKVLNVADTRPYTYNIKTNRKNITWYKNNREMSYEIERIFKRDPTQFHPSSMTDRGHFVNMVRALIRSKFEMSAGQAFEIAAADEPPFRDNPVELLEGYLSTASVQVQKQMKGPNTEKYGLVYRQNGSRLYNMTIKTDLYEKGQMLKFASEISSFSVQSPSYYNFSVYDGLTFPAMLSNQPKLHIFNSDFCSPVRIEFAGKVSKFGFGSLHKYVLKLIDFTKCTDGKDFNTCPEVDKLDISKCLSDTLPSNTIFLSKAHFYGSSNETIQEMNIKGFQPSADKHDSVMYFEPHTGTPIQAIYRIQMNIEATIDPMRLSEGGQWKMMDRRGEQRTLPIFWIEQTVDLSQETITKISKLSNILDKLRPSIVFPVAIGLCFVFVTVIELSARFLNC